MQVRSQVPTPRASICIPVGRKSRDVCRRRAVCTPGPPAPWEADVGGSPELRSPNPAGATWRNLVSRKNYNQRDVVVAPVTPATREAETTGTCHHARLIFLFVVETGFRQVGQASLECLTSGDPPALATQCAGITGVSRRAWPDLTFFFYKEQTFHLPWIKRRGLEDAADTGFPRTSPGRGSLQSWGLHSRGSTERGLPSRLWAPLRPRRPPRSAGLAADPVVGLVNRWPLDH